MSLVFAAVNARFSTGHYNALCNQQDARHSALCCNGTVVLPFMPWPAYSRWNRDELHAVWLYLRSLKSVSHRVPASSFTGAAANGKGSERGEAIFRSYCRTCHGDKGLGSPFTSVVLRDAAHNLNDTDLATFIREGLPGTAMPSFAKTLTQDQIEDVIQYFRSW